MSISLHHESSRASIDPSGGKIEQMELNGTRFIDSLRRGDGKPCITHPCSPLFGPETGTQFGLAQHGPVRQCMWTIVEQSESEATLSCPIEQGDYPVGVSITQTFQFSPQGFIIETQHTNNAAVPVPVNFAQHFYFSTPQGWETAKVNDKPCAQLAKQTQSMAWEDTNRISLPGQPDLYISHTGLPWVTFWAYGNEPQNSFDTHYICIEPSEGQPKSDFFGSPTSLISPGQSRITRLTLSIHDLRKFYLSS